MRRALTPELMDDPFVPSTDLERNLREIERANAWFGGIAPIVREVRHAGARHVLDVGSGSGDVARALVRDARLHRVERTVTCLDRSAEMLAIARERAGDDPRLRFVQGDGMRLPFADGAFDAVVCALALHHFQPVNAVALLRELRRVARTTPIVCDLVRSFPAYVATLAFARVLARDPLTANDAPLSVRRAYRPEEALALATHAGWRRPLVRREAWFRMTLVDAA